MIVKIDFTDEELEVIHRSLFIYMMNDEVVYHDLKQKEFVNKMRVKVEKVINLNKE